MNRFGGNQSYTINGIQAYRQWRKLYLYFFFKFIKEGTNILANHINDLISITILKNTIYFGIHQYI